MNDAFDIEELLKDNLKNKGKKPPIGLFEEIEERLIRKKRRRRLFWILFWLGLGIGTYFGCSKVITMFNPECDCPTVKCTGEILDNTGNFMESEKQNPTKSMRVIAESKATQNDASPVTPTQNLIELPPLLKNQFLNNSDSLVEDEWNLEVAQIGAVESDRPNNISVQSEASEKIWGIHSNNSKGVTHSKSKAQPNNDTVGEVKKPELLLALIVKPETDSLSTKTSKEDIFEKEGILQNDSTPLKEPKSNRSEYGLIAYAGPSFFDIAVFKPYLSSGSLTNRPFKSSGFEVGIGSFKSIKERWKVNMSIAYNLKQSHFQYDLLVSETDYFNYYDNGVLISVDQLDQEESCNCFVAKDVQLKYDINTINFSIGFSYQLVEFKKFNLLGNFNVFSNVFTQLKNTSNSVVDFPSKKTETFNSIGLKPGFTIDYALTKNTRLTLSPNYTYQFTKDESSFYARPLHEIIVSLGITFLF